MGQDKGNGLGGLGAELKLRNGANMASNYTLIVFDCDGTLADSQYVITEAMRFAFQSAGLAAPERCAILRTIGLSLPEAIADLAPDHCPEDRHEIVGAFRDHCTAIRQRSCMQEQMFLGAASLLSGLAAREDVILGLATGKSRRGVMRFIEQNALHGVFSTIQTADEAPSKPHPGMLFQAMEETGASPESTVMIGDTTHDMLMAASANVAGIGVSWGYHTPADLTRAGAKIIVRTFAALAQALARPELSALRYEAA
jgi:phosphoglycolate phosphatase